MWESLFPPKVSFLDRLPPSPSNHAASSVSSVSDRLDSFPSSLSSATGRSHDDLSSALLLELFAFPLAGVISPPTVRFPITGTENCSRYIIKYGGLHVIVLILLTLTHYSNCISLRAIINQCLQPPNSVYLLVRMHRDSAPDGDHCEAQHVAFSFNALLFSNFIKNLRDVSQVNPTPSFLHLLFERNAYCNNTVSTTLHFEPFRLCRRNNIKQTHFDLIPTKTH